MPAILGTIIAERHLDRPGSKRRVLARLGRPRRSRRAPWECPYQVVGGLNGQVRRALGEDALQSLLLACVGLRQELDRVGASWLGPGSSGIPPFVPDMFGADFTAHLEAVIEREVAKSVRRLEQIHKGESRRKTKEPANQALQPTSRARRAGKSTRRARAARG
jgi:hypothetical protein